MFTMYNANDLFSSKIVLTYYDPDVPQCLRNGRTKLYQILGRPTFLVEVRT